jgi:hypothetical protein
MIISFYPTLNTVFETLLEFNVPEAQHAKIRDKMQTIDLEPVGVFDRAEEELSKFSGGQLDELLIGEQDDESYVSEDTTDVITAIFEMITK